jgi:predicted helicase
MAEQSWTVRARCSGEQEGGLLTFLNDDPYGQYEFEIRSIDVRTVPSYDSTNFLFDLNSYLTSLKKLRDLAFDNFIPLAPIKKFDSKTETFFVTNIIGVSSNRDAWVYNYSKQVIADNMQKMINFYNEQKTAFKDAIINNSFIKIESFINSDPKRISWTRALRNDATKGLEHSFKTNEFKTTSYRPFNKQIFYSHKAFVESPGLSNKLFPNNTLHNIVICVSGIGAQKEFSPFAVCNIPTLDIIHHGQCFPLYYYEENNATQKGLFDAGDNSQDLPAEMLSVILF